MTIEVGESYPHWAIGSQPADPHRYPSVTFNRVFLEAALLIAGFPAGSFQANCYVVAAEAGAECVVVDPGQNAVEGLDEIIAEHRLKPVAVLLTHGHIDHMWSVVPVCGAREIPAL